MHIETHHIAALERAIHYFEKERDKLSFSKNYEAMFPDADASALTEIKNYLQTLQTKTK